MNKRELLEEVERAISAMRDYRQQTEEESGREDGGEQALKSAIDEFVWVAARVMPPPVHTSSGTPMICPHCGRSVTVTLS